MGKGSVSPGTEVAGSWELCWWWDLQAASLPPSLPPWDLWLELLLAFRRFCQGNGACAATGVGGSQGLGWRCCRWSGAAFVERNWCFQVDLGGPEGLLLHMADVSLRL